MLVIPVYDTLILSNVQINVQEDVFSKKEIENIKNEDNFLIVPIKSKKNEENCLLKTFMMWDYWRRQFLRLTMRVITF